LKYIRHLFVSGHSKGRGIHSPYAFSFVNEAVFAGNNCVVHGSLINAHRTVLKDRTPINTGDYGAGSRVSSAGQRSAGSLARWSSVNKKTGRLLCRISHWFEPSVIIELGTGLGISTAYLAAGAPGARVLSMEADRQKSDYARKLVKSLGLTNVEIITGLFDELMTGLPDLKNEKVLIFLDGNHRFDSTIRYLNHFLKSSSKDFILILDDIYWSGEMERAWKEIVKLNEVRISLDLFFLGVLIFRKDLNKEHFPVRW
jgi:predicted O-methyltransferase YrrM